MKEFRPGSSGCSELRVLFAFDPQRSAIILIATDKAGDRGSWYERNTPRAEAHKDRRLAEVRAYRLRELAGLTQAQLAERIGVGKRQVSKIENGDLDSAKIGTIRRYLEAVGGELTVEYLIGDQRVQGA